MAEPLGTGPSALFDLADLSETIRTDLSSAARALAPDDAPPPSIGPYRILGKIGAGGMGVVFRAEQISPRRQVALKLVRGDRMEDTVRVKLFEHRAVVQNAPRMEQILEPVPADLLRVEVLVPQEEVHNDYF